MIKEITVQGLNTEQLINRDILLTPHTFAALRDEKKWGRIFIINCSIKTANN